MGRMRAGLLAVLIAFLSLPAVAQEQEDPATPDYSRERLRSIFFQIAQETEDASSEDPFKKGFRLFEFTIGDSKTTVRFLPFAPLIAGATGVELMPIIDPLLMTGTAGSTMSPRLRSRYSEWWVSRKLGFPIAPPKDGD